MTNELLARVKKYDAGSRSAFAAMLRKEVPCNLPGSLYAGLADTIAMTSAGEIMFPRIGGAPLVVRWERTEDGDKRVTWVV